MASLSAKPTATLASHTREPSGVVVQYALALACTLHSRMGAYSDVMTHCCSATCVTHHRQKLSALE
jgi:hypothetical protein